ncbi:hypothetical protein ASPFODRAFT_350947 [Aspergillus luchuensis CBS 106.47]|uniref:Uncharacterized protein n=1 Tax=Aspergillus luchuensis (strain CBS 106.47) TaxID=1137211 RepID=A0A1M3T676_ASPLC|nr:hypothetical protein ASPFODRAFT_350947 [Aspergillus luchuensis CBS 106.47]
MYPRLPVSVCTGGIFLIWLLYSPLVVYLAFVPSSPSLLFPHTLLPLYLLSSFLHHQERVPYCNSITLLVDVSCMIAN